MSISQRKTSQIIDHRRLALKKTCLSGQVDQIELQELKTVVSLQQGAVSYELNFEFVRGLCVIQGRLESTLCLLCLRCMQPVSCPVVCDIKLVVIEDESKLERVPPGYEAWILTDKPLSVESVLEEELLLSVPLDVRHKKKDCAQLEQDLSSK